MGNAAKFAFANRLVLGLMAVRAIEEASGRTLDTRLVYDAPHNLVFPSHDGERFLHRKGATRADGPADPDWLGKPVIIPGSMGAASYLLGERGVGKRSTAHAMAQAARSPAGVRLTSRAMSSPRDGEPACRRTDRPAVTSARLAA